MLDYDGFGHCSAIEQNFNPSQADIDRRTKLGYPRLLSGDLANYNIKNFIEKHQATLFPEPETDSPWTKVTQQKRYFLSLPQYPFRTLSPREIALISSKSSDFDGTSPLFPANTQLNIVFKKRMPKNFLNCMLPFQLISTLGTNKKDMTAAQRNSALKITVTERVANADTQVNYIINRVTVSVHSMFLQVVTKNKHNNIIKNPSSLYFIFFRLFVLNLEGFLQRNRSLMCTHIIDQFLLPF